LAEVLHGCDADGPFALADAAEAHLDDHHLDDHLPGLHRVHRRVLSLEQRIRRLQGGYIRRPWKDHLKWSRGGLSRLLSGLVHLVLDQQELGLFRQDLAAVELACQLRNEADLAVAESACHY